MDKRIAAGLMVVCFLIMPGIAKANFFDHSEGKWYMHPSQWEEFSSGFHVSETELVDQNNRLEWNTGSGWDDGSRAYRRRSSKWTFDLNDDFTFDVDFLYNYTGIREFDDGGIGIGLFNATESSYAFSIAAENWWGNWNGKYENGNTFKSSINLPEDERVRSWWLRDTPTGKFRAHYNSSNDELKFTPMEELNPNQHIPVGEITYEGIKNLGINHLGVYLEGWSDGAGLVSGVATGEAYLENFQVTKGTITPEPVSSVLFLVGGASLVALRRRKQRK